MPDKKLTDTEIIKALECCGSNDPCSEECFGHDMNGIAACTKILAQNALDLINRQKAEIERLKAEGLKEKTYTNNYCQEIVLKDDIDNLVKEMVGEDK